MSAKILPFRLIKPRKIVRMVESIYGQIGGDLAIELSNRFRSARGRKPVDVDVVSVLKGPGEMPEGDEWPEVFRCVCRRGKQSWRDEQGHYACGKCPIEYSPDPKQQAVVQRMANGEARRVLSRERAWARAGAGARPVRLR